MLMLTRVKEFCRTYQRVFTRMNQSMHERCYPSENGSCSAMSTRVLLSRTKPTLCLPLLPTRAKVSSDRLYLSSW